MDKKGQMVMIQLLILTMTIAIMIAVIPMLNTLLGTAKQSDNLNCAGYDYDKNGTVGDHSLDYNESYATDTISCIAIAMFVPYIVLALLIGGVAKLLMRPGQPGDQYGGY